MAEPELTGFAIALAGGVLSFASPCVLALVPGYLSFLSGVPVDRLGERPRGALVGSFAFVAGFSLVFILLGAGLGQITALLRSERGGLEVAGGTLLVLFGLLALLGPRLGLLQGEWRPVALGRRGPGRTLTGAVTGIVFAIGWTPCIGPVLGGILTFAATGQSQWGGAALLAVYSLGLGVPFLVTAVAFERASRAFGRVRRLGPILNAVGGVGLVVMGVLVATGQLALITQELARHNRFG